MAARLSALVIDDDPLIRRVVVRQLESLGVGRIADASGGAEALALLREGATFDLVVCDLQMPEGDGIEFLREFGALCPQAGLILMSSADADILEAAASLAQQRRIRLLGTVAKPVARSRLATLVAAAAADASQAAAAEPVGAASPIGADELRAALAAGEFGVHVQPKVGLTTFELLGVEALVRWNSAARGLVLPAAFIGLCERHGLLQELTFAVVRGAIDAVAAWRAQGLETCIAVNFDAPTLCGLDVPDRLSALLAVRGLSSRHFVVELTESSVAANLQNLLDVATRLRLRGIHLSIDDFGTGYSSLTQLRALPFTELKIDQSFVMTARHNPSSRAIVESSVGLAHKLGMKALAEGIETVEDLLLMRELGCDVGQGALTGMPFEARDLPQWELQRPRTVADFRAVPT
ncbi:MAG TPA: EAL domain-containing response regulator [Nevskiaceae bacterium]|nr:EAL domain-containing response regulator [Nevskiaceae bacterium]